VGEYEYFLELHNLSANQNIENILIQAITEMVLMHVNTYY